MASKLRFLRLVRSWPGRFSIRLLRVTWCLMVPLVCAVAEGQEGAQKILDQVGLKSDGKGGFVMNHVPTPLQTSNPSKMPAAWSRNADLDCGANSLFMYLRLLGHDVVLSDIRARIPTSDRGASMLDLKNAAASLGVTCDVVDGPVESIRNRLPAIVRLAPDGASTDIGHFVVLVNSDKDGVTLLDGTTGMSSSTSHANFAADYSGFAIPRPGSVNQSGPFLLVDTFLLAIVATELVAIAVLMFRKFRRSESPLRVSSPPA